MYVIILLHGQKMVPAGVAAIQTEREKPHLQNKSHVAVLQRWSVAECDHMTRLHHTHTQLNDFAFEYWVNWKASFPLWIS